MERGLMQKLQKWHEEDRFQEIIEAIEALPEEEKNDELVGQLARAYNNRGERGDYKRAIALLQEIGASRQEDPNWHFRLGYAYYYLDQDAKALAAFTEALRLDPQDEDAEELIRQCRRNLAYPALIRPFADRVREFWQAFGEQEAGLRELLDRRDDLEPAAELAQELLQIAFGQVYFELGFSGEKYELSVTAEGQKPALFKIRYWQKQAPEELKARWIFCVGRQAANVLRMYDLQMTAQEVLLWPEVLEGKQMGARLYSEKWLPLLTEDENAAYSMAAILLDECIGEASAIVHIDYLELLTEPAAGEAIRLSELAEFIAEQVDDHEGSIEPLDYYTSYQREPNISEEGWDLREDVMVGGTACLEVVDAYYQGEGELIDEHQADGVIFGFLFYDNKQVESAQMVSYRAEIEDELRDKAAESADIIGGATGRVYSYIDVVCYDLQAFLAVAAELLNGRSVLTEIGFHVFRRDAGGVNLKKRDTLLPGEMVNFLKECDEDGRMDAILGVLEDFIRDSVTDGDFTEEDALHDREIALWMAYAHSNYDTYEHYWESAQWLSRVEDKARGCGVWYYRYAVALMYLGRLEEALDYAEKGVLEEAEYPWGWLNLAGLRSHFGDTEGALEAITQGMALVGDDYEFLRRRAEILAEKSLEEMELHYIDEEADRELAERAMDGEIVAVKQQAIAGIICDRDNLEAIKEALALEDWEQDTPYCRGQMAGGEQSVEVVFRMNGAALSKMAPQWLCELKSQLPRRDEAARKWLDEVSEGRIPIKRLALHALTILRDSRYILSYKEKRSESEGVWTVSFLADGEVDEREQSNYFPEVYTEEEFDAVEAHISRYFGEYNGVMHELVSPDIHVDICIVEPSSERNYYTLVTCGAGAHRMNLSEDMAAQQWGRAEVLICLPPDWDIRSGDERWYWPLRLLKAVARLAKGQDTWIGPQHTIGHEGPYAEGTDFCGAILLHPQDAPEGCDACVLPDGDEVNFYQLFPLYEEEINYKLQNGGDALMETMASVDHVVDVYRPNAHAGYERRSDKTFFLQAEDMLPLLTNWDEADGCIASDRITVDGAPVGYMYREEPSEDYPDSGWRFAAGDESDAYQDDPQRLDVYTLNTICNYDPDILPLLKFPIGTAFYRDSNGEFRREETPFDDEDADWQ